MSYSTYQEQLILYHDLIVLPLCYRDELLETSPNKAYSTTHHQVTTPTDECQYENLNMCRDEVY